MSIKKDEQKGRVLYGVTSQKFTPGARFSKVPIINGPIKL